MPAMSTLKEMTSDEALTLIDGGAVLLDLRKVDDYLDVHVPGSIALQFEDGPGTASRARDCLPLDVPMLLFGSEREVSNTASALRGKGFHVVGSVDDAVNGWAAARGAPASTEVLTGPEPKGAGLIIDVADPGARVVPEATRIPIERLWSRLDEVVGHAGATVVAGFGIRAAMAVGMLERAGVKDVSFWRSRL